MPKRPKPTGNGGAGETVDSIKQQIDEKKTELMRLRLEDVSNEVGHQRNINELKNEIRELTEQLWRARQDIANSKVKVSEIKVQDANESIAREEEISSLQKTLQDERVTRMKRRIYEQLEGVESEY